MRRFLTGALPVHPLPAGIEIRPVTPETERAIFVADNEAFEDHWGHREQGEGDFIARFRGPDVDTRLWRVAWDGDEVAGAVMNAIFRGENETLGVQRGWLDHVSVRRPWRGKGLAKALCAASFQALRDEGMTEAWLGVDGSNPTGALQLYEGLGFGVARRWQAFGRPLDRPAPEGWTRAQSGGATGWSGEAGARWRTISIQAALAADRRARGPPCPGEHPQVVLELGEPAERLDHELRRPARQVHPAPAAGEQRVAAEQQPVVCGEETDRPLGVARRVEDAQPDLPEPDLAALGELDGGHGRRDLERRVQRLRVRQPVRVERVDRDRGAGVLGDRGVRARVVPVPVRAHDELEGPVPLRERIRDPGQARDRGVDRDRLARRRVAEDVDVRRERADDRVQALHRREDRTSWGRPANGAYSGRRCRDDDRAHPGAPQPVG